jgi:phosphoglycolate phosphatase-like HAD superfamily hydrolase
VRCLLVLWDIDFTLIDAGGVGTRLYRMVFRDMFGADLPAAALMAGRTDRAIVARLASLAPTGRELTEQHSRALPGAAAALDALAAFAPGQDGDGTGGQARQVCVVQSVLTGNVRAMAEMKLGALGLDGHLDLDAGAYGESHEVRAELVHLARDNAARRYGTDFSGLATVLVGDTPLDVAAALETGARAVAVATGGTTAAALAESGADAVLPDLTDTPAVLAAILAGP